MDSCPSSPQQISNGQSHLSQKPMVRTFVLDRFPWKPKGEKKTSQIKIILSDFKPSFDLSRGYSRVFRGTQKIPK